MKIEDLAVSNPIKKGPVAPAIEIEGSFECQNCYYESEKASMTEGNLWWICPECKYRSVVKGFG